MAMFERLRAPIQWVGGKGQMIAKLMKHVPLGGKPYCEPYMGAATLFFARDPAPVEVLNDMDGDLVNLFRCLQDKTLFEELKWKIQYTIYARAELVRAMEILKDKSVTDRVLRAWAFFVLHNMKMGTDNSWGRTFTSVNGCADTVNNWIMRLTMLDDWHKRLLFAQIDNRDAIDVIRYWDTPDTVFYVDPPYHLDTRKTKQVYAVEPDSDHHIRLVDTLLKCQGAVVLSGYDHPVYAPLSDAGWQVTRYQTACHAACRTRFSGLKGSGAALQKVPRVEVVWANPKAVAMRNPIKSLFQE
jgi:DNA adenine methylase